MSARRHTQCPPVHHAGYLDCPLCGSKGYTTEATWLDDERILATYVPSCTQCCLRPWWSRGARVP